MANLNLRSFSQLVSNGTAAVQAGCNQILDFTPGSVIRSFVEATSAVGLWLQELAFQVLQTTRLATSVGTDCDSFGADFGYVDSNRGGIAASGVATFSRYIGTGTTIIPLLQDDDTPTTVRSFDGLQTFTVILDPANLTFDSTQQAYVMLPNVTSINVPIMAVTQGVIGNVQANSITLISSNIAGVDTVTNQLAFANGIDPNNDASYRAHFVNWVNSRSLGTSLAVKSAVENTQGVVSYSLLENADTSGGTVLGLFTVTIDDGSGSPPSSLISAVSSNVDLVRPLGSSFTIRVPTVITVNINMTLTAQSGFLKGLMLKPVQAAVTSFVSQLGVGDDLPYARLVQIAFDAVPGIANVTNVMMNNGTSDIVTSPLQLVRVGLVTVV